MSRHEWVEESRPRLPAGPGPLPDPIASGLPARLHDRSGFVVSCHGVRIRFRLNDPSFGPDLLAVLPPGWRVSRTAEADVRYVVLMNRTGVGVTAHTRHQALVGTRLLRESGDPERIFQALGADVHFRVAVKARDRVFVRAGAVGWRGRSIILPGAPGTGRTTLVRALVEAGARYYSDLFAVVGPYGTLHAYPVHLAGLGPPRDSDLFEVVPEGPPDGTPLPPGLVAFTRYRRGATWRPRTMRTEEAVSAVARHAVLESIRPDLVRERLHRAVSGALVLEGVRGDARATAASLIVALERGRPT